MPPLLAAFLGAFLVGGLLCVAAQLFVDLAKMQAASVMVLFVSLGAVASGLGLYEPLIKFGGAGATVPLPGFGHTLVQGIIMDISRHGFNGLLGGGLEAAAMGITAAVIFGYLAAVLFNPKA